MGNSLIQLIYVAYKLPHQPLLHFRIDFWHKCTTPWAARLLSGPAALPVLELASWYHLLSPSSPGTLWCSHSFKFIQELLRSSHSSCIRSWEDRGQQRSHWNWRGIYYNKGNKLKSNIHMYICKNTTLNTWKCWRKLFFKHFFLKP